MSARPRPAVFLDRDGVINRDLGYVHRVQDFVFLPGVPQAMQLLRRLGFTLTVVTNQSGIARGLYSQADYQRVTEHMVAELARHAVDLAAVAHCPHLPDAVIAEYRLRCGCRKPAPGMLLELAESLNLDLASSIMIGDKLSDMQAGRAAGVGRCWLVHGHDAPSASDAAAADAVYADLAACAAALQHAAVGMNAGTSAIQPRS